MIALTAVFAVYLVVGALTQRFAPSRSGNEPEPR
jgi:hypothetical protein